jgi:hypothetical protein
MDDQLSLAREILRQVLATGPQKGARLKGLLSREFERRTETTFPQAFWKFRKFSAFLAANADLLEIVPPDGPGDITVRLRQPGTPDQLAASSPSLASPGKSLPPAVWNAFTNPDPRRHRFFHRGTGNVAHYLEASKEYPNPKIAAVVAGDSNYVEIIPVSAEQQRSWLVEFLASVQVPESKRSLLATLSAAPYSSAVNTAFVATLGEYAESWRQFRASRVQGAVRDWAEQTGVPFDQVVGLSVPPRQVESTPQEAATLAPPSVDELRRWLHSVIDNLDAAGVSQILLPAGALFKLTVHSG